MANSNSPFGLRPVRYKDGRPYNGAVNFYFATGATGVISPGDPVINNGAANTAEVAGFQAGSLPGCQIALDGAGDPITGVCVAVLPITRDSLPYRETSTDRVIVVADDPGLVFQVQETADGTALASTDVGQLVNLKPGSASLPGRLTPARRRTPRPRSSVTSTVSHRFPTMPLAPTPFGKSPSTTTSSAT